MGDLGLDAAPGLVGDHALPDGIVSVRGIAVGRKMEVAAIPERVAKGKRLGDCPVPVVRVVRPGAAILEGIFGLIDPAGPARKAEGRPVGRVEPQIIVRLERAAELAKAAISLVEHQLVIPAEGRGR